MAVEPPPHKRRRHEVTRRIDLHVVRTTKRHSYQGDLWDSALEVATDLQLPPEIRNIVRTYADPCRRPHFEAGESTDHTWVRECLSHPGAAIELGKRESVLSTVFCATCGDTEIIAIRDGVPRR